MAAVEIINTKQGLQFEHGQIAWTDLSTLKFPRLENVNNDSHKNVASQVRNLL